MLRPRRLLIEWCGAHCSSEALRRLGSIYRAQAVSGVATRPRLPGAFIGAGSSYHGDGFFVTGLLSVVPCFDGADGLAVGLGRWGVVQKSLLLRVKNSWVFVLKVTPDPVAIRFKGRVLVR